MQWGREPGRSELEDGTRVSAETSRRLSCDASVVRVTYDRDGSVLDVGRRTRTIPPALRRALDVRDRGCRFPGCGVRFTDGHHVIHWADGGPTSLSNTVLLCEFHHRLLHEGGYRVEMAAGRLPNFYDPRGIPVPDQPPTIRLRDGAGDALVQHNLLRGIDPDFRTCAARYRREEDIPWTVVVGIADVIEASS